MKTNILILLSALLTLLFQTTTRAADNDSLMHGTITWNDGAAAAGVKIHIEANGGAKVTVESDASGNYDIRDLPRTPADYTIQIEYRGNVIKTLRPEDLKATARGGRLDIKLDR